MENEFTQSTYNPNRENFWPPSGEEQMLDDQYKDQMEFETWLDSKKVEYEQVLGDMGAFRRALEDLEVKRRRLAYEIDSNGSTEERNDTGFEPAF